MFQRKSPTVTRGQLAPGRVGTAQTLELMRQLVNRGARSLPVREAALQAIRRAGVRAQDHGGELRAVFAYVRDRIRFVRDPLGIEHLQSPDYTLTAGMGDCDDKATLLAAMLRTIGHPARLAFRAIGTRPSEPGRFTHVFVMADEGGRPVALDPTQVGTPFGWQYPRPTVTGELRL